MTLQVGDLVLYGSTGRPSDDASATGGSIDLTARPFTSPILSPSAIELISSSSSDTRGVTVKWRSTDFDLNTWTPTLAGTSAVLLSTGTVEHLVSVILSSVSTAHVVAIQISSGETLHLIGPGEIEAFRLFQGAVAGATRYEKLFLKNLSTEGSLLSAALAITEDDSTQYRVGLSASKDSTDGWANRLTDPGYSWLNTSSGLAVPTGTLGPGESIGIGVEQTLAGGVGDDAPTFDVTAFGRAIVST